MRLSMYILSWTWTEFFGTGWCHQLGWLGEDVLSLQTGRFAVLKQQAKELDLIHSGKGRVNSEVLRLWWWRAFLIPDSSCGTLSGSSVFCSIHNLIVIVEQVVTMVSIGWIVNYPLHHFWSSQSHRLCQPTKFENILPRSWPFLGRSEKNWLGRQTAESQVLSIWWPFTGEMASLL